MLGKALLLLTVCGCALATFNLPDEYYESFEYSHVNSFRGPFFVVGGNSIPFWKFGEDAVATEDYIRLTSKPSQTGLLRNEKPLLFSSWDLILEWRIHGKSGTQGADGMALWITQTPVEHDGPALGGPGHWKGVGVAFDSFDNDRDRNNPRVSLLSNDGSRVYREDGKKLELAGCNYGYRNFGSPMIARIQYSEGLLSISIGLKDQNIDSFYKCVKNQPVEIPTGYYISITAATGDLADNHDVYSLSTFNLNPDTVVDPNDIPEQALDNDDGLHKMEKESSDLLRGEEGEMEEEEVLSTDFPTHHAAASLKDQFKEIYNALNGMRNLDHPENVDFELELKLPQIKELKTDEERYAYVLDSIFAIQDQQDAMLTAFESLLERIDKERFAQQETHSRFADALTKLYENVAAKSDVEDVLGALAGKASLVEAVNKLNSAAVHAYNELQRSGAVAHMTEVAKELPQLRSRVQAAHSANTQSLTQARREMVDLLRTAKGGISYSVLDYVIFAEVVGFVLFVVFTLVRRPTKSRGALL